MNGIRLGPQEPSPYLALGTDSTGGFSRPAEPGLEVLNKGIGTSSVGKAASDFASITPAAVNDFPLAIAPRSRLKRLPPLRQAIA
jgi:hypothetical protein